MVTSQWFFFKSRIVNHHKWWVEILLGIDLKPGVTVDFYQAGFGNLKISLEKTMQAQFTWLIKFNGIACYTQCSCLCWILDICSWWIVFCLAIVEQVLFVIITLEITLPLGSVFQIIICHIHCFVGKQKLLKLIGKALHKYTGTFRSILSQFQKFAFLCTYKCMLKKHL